MFKVNNKNTRKSCKMCSKLTVKRLGCGSEISLKISNCNFIIEKARLEKIISTRPIGHPELSARPTEKRLEPLLFLIYYLIRTCIQFLF